jgi:hypothetical protein
MARMSYKKARLLLDMSLGDGTDKSAAWEVVRAYIKEAQPTVRQKPPIQQRKHAICAVVRANDLHKEVI